MKHIALVAFAFVSASTACIPCMALASNRDLARLEAADQADRSAGSNRIDWDIVGKHDADRRADVARILKAGNVRTSDDYFRAALIYQHGESIEEIELALSLATTASHIDPSNTDAKVLSAQAWDRILVKMGKPQWYGTQFSKDKSTGRWALYTVDPTAVTEAQRQATGVPTLAETQAHLDQLNDRH